MQTSAASSATMAYSTPYTSQATPAHNAAGQGEQTAGIMRGHDSFQSSQALSASNDTARMLLTMLMLTALFGQSPDEKDKDENKQLLAMLVLAAGLTQQGGCAQFSSYTSTGAAAPQQTTGTQVNALA